MNVKRRSSHFIEIKTLNYSSFNVVYLTKRLINQDREVVFQLPKKEKELRKKYSGAGTGIRCRLVTVTLDNGTREVLCSSLLGKEAFSTDCFAGLYLYK